MARLARAIEAASADPFTRLEIGAVIEVFDKAAGIGRNCRFPFERRRINKRTMENLPSTYESATRIHQTEQISTTKYNV
jgi:hypothetical protein